MRANKIIEISLSILVVVVVYLRHLCEDKEISLASFIWFLDYLNRRYKKVCFLFSIILRSDSKRQFFLKKNLLDIDKIVVVSVYFVKGIFLFLFVKLVKKTLKTIRH